MYDIVIVGAGPAGANLARLIGNKFKLLLIDQRDLADQNPTNCLCKCCGGLLAPDAQKMLATLGLALPKEILVDPQLFAVRTIDLVSQIERLYQRFYFNMNREKFDRWMISLIPGSVETRFNAVFRSIETTDGGYIINYTVGGQILSAKTKLVIGADGANSGIRRYISGANRTPDFYIAVQEWFENTLETPYYTAIFDERISDFYSWIIPKDNYLLLGAALRPRDHTSEKYEQLKSKLSQMGFHFDKRIKREGALINRPRKISQLYAGRDNIALIGEAAGAISPSSAEGISYALKSSLYLSQSFEYGLEGVLGRYQQQLRQLKRNLLIKNAKSPAMYAPNLRKLIMSSGLQSIN